MKREAFLIFSLFIICVFSRCKVDNTQKVFDKITVSSEHHSFIYLFADQSNYFSDDAQDTVFNRVLAGNVSGVNSSKLHGMVLFPDKFFDASLSTSTAESFMSLFNSNGNNTFALYPAIAEGLTDHEQDYDAWKTAIATTQNTPADCGIGLLKEEFGTNINVYAKVNFYNSVSDSVSLAVYLVENGIKAKQIIAPGDTSYAYIHQHVLRSSLNGDFGSGLADFASSGDVYKVTVPFVLTPEINKNNIEFIAVVYQIHDDKPFKILNCTSIK